MKKLNALKLIIAIMVACCFETKAQYIDEKFWNSNTLNAKDVGQAIAADTVNKHIYVAGTYNTGLSNQAIRIMKYDGGLNQLAYRKYDSAYYKESVSQIIFKNNKIYLIGNAIDTAGNATMFLLRLNTSLAIEKAQWFKFNTPVKAILGDNNDIYIACYKKVAGVNRFALLRTDFNFATLNWQQPSDSTYKRTPTDLVYKGGYVYVCGSAKSGTLSPANSGFAIKFSAGLGQLWEHNASASALAQNGYNTIALTLSDVYVGGSEYNLNDKRWVMRKLSKSTGAVAATHRTGGSNFSGDISSVFKITVINNYTLYVIGSVKNQTQNTFIIKSAKYNSNLGSFLSTNLSLDYDSKLNDAVSYSDGSVSFVTGSTKIGTDHAFFYRSFDNNNLTLGNGYTNINRNAGGNKVIFTPGFAGYPYAAIVGFIDANSGILAEDLEMYTLTLSTIIDRLSSTNLTSEKSSFTMFPNPATDELTIESKEPISSWVIYDMIGKSVMEQQIGEETFQERINISTLPKGIYLLKVNNNATQKIIKN